MPLLGAPALLGRPNEVGHLAATSADSAPGLSATGYQSADIASAYCDTTEYILPLLDRNASKGHGGSKSQALAQRAKVGRCPRRVAAAQVAVPATYSGGE